MDDLKKYFQKQEAGMQVETLDETALWRRIAAKQKKHQPKRGRITAMRFAAAACIVLLVGLGIQQWMKGIDEPIKKPGAQNNNPVTKELVSQRDTINQQQPFMAKQPESKNEEHNLKTATQKKAQPVSNGYSDLVAYQLERLRRTPVYAETPDFFNEFSQQLQQMDKDEAAVKNDIQTYGYNEQVADALATIYQQKLSLLEGLQREIKKMNKSVQRKQNNAVRQPYYLNL